MRTTDERMAALTRRTKEIKRQQRIKKGRIVATCSLCVCLLAICGLSWLLPGMTLDTPHMATTIGGAASIFQHADFLKLVLIGVVSFVLGSAVTLLCVLLHRRNREDGDDD